MASQKSSGKLFIVSAPSGAGKTTICNAVVERFKNLIYSISYTTRPPREGEKNGQDYFFISDNEFKKQTSQNGWAEWAEVHGNFYGTSASFIDEHLALGRDILLDIDVQGAKQLLRRYPDSITVFIMPPSLKILKTRLKSRKTDSKEIIERRFENAKKEIEKKNMYQHIIINDDLKKAIREMASIIENGHSAE